MKGQRARTERAGHIETETEMTTFATDTTITTSAAEVTADRRPLWKHGLAATAAAAVATTTIAAVAHAAGVTFADRTGAGIPLVGFAQLTLMFSLIGVALAATMARRAKQPRRTFVRTTVTLVGVSFVPDLLVGFDAASALTLMALHTVAAAIVIPTLAGRLAGRR
jgi:amino acid transporter